MRTPWAPTVPKGFDAPGEEGTPPRGRLRFLELKAQVGDQGTARFEPDRGSRELSMMIAAARTGAREGLTSARTIEIGQYVISCRFPSYALNLLVSLG